MISQDRIKPLSPHDHHAINGLDLAHGGQYPASRSAELSIKSFQPFWIASGPVHHGTLLWG